MRRFLGGLGEKKSCGMLTGISRVPDALLSLAIRAHFIIYRLPRYTALMHTIITIIMQIHPRRNLLYQPPAIINFYHRFWKKKKTFCFVIHLLIKTCGAQNKANYIVKIYIYYLSGGRGWQSREMECTCGKTNWSRSKLHLFHVSLAMHLSINIIRNIVSPQKIRLWGLDFHLRKPLAQLACQYSIESAIVRAGHSSLLPQ